MLYSYLITVLIAVCVLNTNSYYVYKDFGKNLMKNIVIKY